MTMTADMMKAMSMPAGMDMSAMQDCMDQCSMCMQACTMCADQMAGMEGMGRCASMSMTCADVCDTTMRMMMRPMGMDMGALESMLRACMAMCEATMAECRIVTLEPAIEAHRPILAGDRHSVSRARRHRVSDPSRIIVTLTQEPVKK